MSLKPLNDRVLVKRLESEERTASGLYIPDTAKEKPSKGEVVAVGPCAQARNVCVMRRGIWKSFRHSGT